jgi:hypothetical protein
MFINVYKNEILQTKIRDIKFIKNEGNNTKLKPFYS